MLPRENVKSKKKIEKEGKRNMETQRGKGSRLHDRRGQEKKTIHLFTSQKRGAELLFFLATQCWE